MRVTALLVRLVFGELAIRFPLLINTILRQHVYQMVLHRSYRIHPVYQTLADFVPTMTWCGSNACRGRHFWQERTFDSQDVCLAIQLALKVGFFRREQRNPTSAPNYQFFQNNDPASAGATFFRFLTKIGVEIPV
jgi:hypothetical protein